MNNLSNEVTITLGHSVVADTASPSENDASEDFLEGGTQELLADKGGALNFNPVNPDTWI